MLVVTTVGLGAGRRGTGAGVTVWSLGCCCGEDRSQDQTHQLISTRLGFELDYRRINIWVRVVTSQGLKQFTY